MKKVAVIYWSGTGNTQSMAEAIAEGVNNGGGEALLMNVANATREDVFNYDAVALGCPSMGAEVLEEDEMEPFVESLKDDRLSNKPIALFGSYDWGNGEWMADWENRMREYGAILVGKGLIVNLTPEAKDIEECKQLGRRLLE